MWVGSLDSFDEGVGYWLITNDEYIFQYGMPSDALTRNSNVFRGKNKELRKKKTG